MDDSQLFKTLTQTVPGIVWVSDSEGKVIFNNAHWSEFTGLPQEQGLGHGWLDAIHPADASIFRAQLPFKAQVQETKQVELRVRRHDGVYHRHLISVRHVGDGMWVGCAIDAQEWITAEIRDLTQTKILDMLSMGAELNEVLSELCRSAEKHIPGSICSILLVDEDGEYFSSGIGPQLPDELLRNVPSIKIAPGMGSCGTAAYEKRDVISKDIATDPLWEGWRDLILPFGFRACWSKPLFGSHGKVIASFGFYFREPRAPSPVEHAEMDRLRRLASLAIERARMLEALRESEEHYRHTVEQNPQIAWTASPQGDVLSASTRWEEFTGLSLEQSLGNGWLRALHPDDVAPTIESWEEALSTGRALDINYRLRMKDGHYRWTRARASARRDRKGKILRWYGTVEDIHERHLAEVRLKRQAYQDDLTGLPNRRRFVDELRRRLNGASGPIGLMVLDMDDFKLVNDRFGHLTGDAVLRLFGRHLQKLVEPFEFVARLGGDEFAIIGKHCSDEACLLARAKHLEEQLDARLRTNRKSRLCRPSIGCTLGHPNEHPDEVFKRADLALYAAKSSGKGSVKLFDPAIRNAAERRSAELELARLALKENWIEAYYQPVISLGTGRACGFEALLRIRHPERGVLAPFAIKSALDDPRLADAIAIRMAHTVVDNISAWSDAGVDFGAVSINLATENLINREFVTTLLDLLDSRGLRHGSVKLEITERVLMDELGDNIRANLGWLRAQGIGISLDDFGTGYASLIHLKTLQVDEIKIDRSFVSGLGTPANGGEIVRAMIGLAKTLGLKTVAEGIETQGEALLLSAWGCENGQGYLFSRPMPFDQVCDYLSGSLMPKRLAT
ncbi:EAL domain-containing protein [Chelativorans intermedius]|uniref:EAL domain-containing protein n=1 Tax=Chelativorans intermedius TaxID=515947 RepID=A0ABV6D2R5_9HYPH|nr:EAL domain-containing protein [Chelativorans intermedius]MCT8997291.1 EAL domain-containing protein [Chelativorans intermedius]